MIVDTDGRLSTRSVVDASHVCLAHQILSASLLLSPRKEAVLKLAERMCYCYTICHYTVLTRASLNLIHSRKKLKVDVHL